MKKRALGNSGMFVSEVGFGTWPLCDDGWGRLATDDEAVFLLHQAHDLGCNFFDTAPQFGQGRGEILLGKALKKERNWALLCSKFGYSTQGKRREDARELESALDESLKRLQTDHLDVYLFDAPGLEALDESHALYEGFEKLKQKGKIRAWGVCVDDHQSMLLALERKLGSVLEVRFNVLSQEPAEHFGLATKLGMGLVARTPLDSGWLGGNYDKHTKFHGIRQRWTKEVRQRRLDLVEKLNFLTKPGTSLAQSSLQFVLSYPEISCAIPAARDAQQLEYNVSAASFTLDPNLKEKTEDFFFRNIKGNPLPW